jgi:hypothetical protein
VGIKVPALNSELSMKRREVLMLLHKATAATIESVNGKLVGI